MEYQLGQIWLQEDLYAPEHFALPKSAQELEVERAALEEQKVLFFDSNPSKQEAWGQVDSVAFQSFMDQLEGIRLADQVPALHGDLAYVNGMPQDVSTIAALPIVLERFSVPDTILVEPDVLLNVEKTDSVHRHKVNAITLNKGLIQQGDAIILRGATVTKERYEVLRALEANYRGGERQLSTWQQVGQVLYFTIVILLLLVFLNRYHNHVLMHSSSLNLFLFLTVLMAGTGLALVQLNLAAIYLVPFMLFPTIIRSFFSDQLALMGHVFLVLLLVPFVPHPTLFISVQFLATFVLLFNIEGIYKRSRLFQTTLAVIGAMLVVFLADHLITGTQWALDNALPFMYAAVGTLALLFVFPIIYFFERVFGVVSDMTLLELSDTNSPLLKRLSKDAPGTFQHTMQVANLAERATELVGGNTLLVRTGALYHDIGKALNPQFFTENQSSGVNPHDDLSYEESAAIIIAHISDGIALAKKHGLPDMIIDFIRTHHGTSRVEYFYRKFKEDHVDEPEFGKFNYPGPKPFSKETAIVMMSDAVEASTRSIPEKTHQNLEDMIDRVIDHQLGSGQLDLASISLKEISIIREGFKKFIKGVYHVRVEYPE